MELLKLVLPSEVVSKVRLYHSHPVADIMRDEIQVYVNDSDCKRFKRKVGREMTFAEYIFDTCWRSSVERFNAWLQSYDAMQIREREERGRQHQLRALAFLQKTCEGCWNSNQRCVCSREVQQMH